MSNNPDTRRAPQRLSLACIFLPTAGEGAENQVHRRTLRNYDLSRGGIQPPPIHRPKFEIKQEVCHLHRDIQGGFEGPPPTNHIAPAAGEGTMNPVPRRTIGEILAMENNGYAFNDWSNNSYNDRPYYDNSYDDWSNNDHSYNDMSYSARSYNGATTHEGYNQREDLFKEIKEMIQQVVEHTDQAMRDIRVQMTTMSNELNEEFERTLMQLIDLQDHVDQISEHLQLMPDETRETHEQEKVMELVHPNQLEGTNDFSPEIHNFEDTKLSCIEQEPSSYLIPFDVYYELFCEKPSFQIEESMTVGNEVDQFKEKSCIDFIFPPNAFDPPEHSSIKVYFMMYSTCVVNFIANFVTTLPWAIVCFLAHIIHCVNRRRTKGPLAQPFDTYD